MDHSNILPLWTSDTSKSRPMDSAETHCFIEATIGHLTGQSKTMKGAEMADLMMEDNPPFEIKIMLKRISVMAGDLDFDPRTVLFLAMMARSAGKAVTIAYFLVRKTRELGRAFTTRDFTDLSPNGVPTEEHFQDVWDSQKIPPSERKPGEMDNWFDRSEAWL